VQNTVQTCANRLSCVSKEELKHLRGFAKDCLERFRLPTTFTDDLTSKAIAAVVQGLSDSGRGRRPRPDNLATHDAFLNFLRGAVASTVEGFARGEYRHPKVAVDVVSLASHRSWPDLDIYLVDLRNELFARLRQQVPHSCQQTLDAWEESFFWSDQIPRVPSPNHSRVVRLLAREILDELGWTPDRHRTAVRNGDGCIVVNFARRLTARRSSPQRASGQRSLLAA